MDSLEQLAQRVERDDPYLVDYLLGWAGLAEPQPWGAATSFAMGVASGYGLIKGESDATPTERGREVAAALRARKDRQ